MPATRWRAFSFYVVFADGAPSVSPRCDKKEKQTHSIEFIPNYAGRLSFAHLPNMSGYVPLPM